MNFNWLISRKVRHADQMAKHVHKILSAQRDILSKDAIDNVDKALRDLRSASNGKLDVKALESRMENLETAANKWLKQHPNPGLRENVEVLLVAIAIAMAIRTFFVQPFKIPTGSMQPTLFGITPSPNDPQDTDFTMPNPVSAFCQYWFRGISYTHIIAKNDGVVEIIDSTPRKFLLFNLKQSFRVGDETYTVWFPPDDLFKRAGFTDGYHALGREFKKGDDLIKLKIIAGDHLFVDRLTYNFRKPKRGEIIVFQTRGIAGIREQDQFYIKRLVALGGEHVRIADDRHLRINNKRLDASTPHFENVYSFKGPPRQSTYSGHVNETIARQQGPQFQNLAPLFPEENAEFVLAPDHYMVMGDNTMNSSDSRTWGDFPQENVIGRSFFVYWPIGRQPDRQTRFGWGTR